MHETINRNMLAALYSYNAYGHGLVLDAAEKLTGEELAQPCSPSHGSVQGLLTHMLECEAFFLAQCQGRPFALEEADVATLPAIRRTWRALAQQQHELIGSLDEAGLAREVHLQIREQPLTFPLWQLLLQALIHSVHHRGELSIVMTGLGHPLPTLDIILHFIEESGQRWPYEA